MIQDCLEQSRYCWRNVLDRDRGQPKSLEAMENSNSCQEATTSHCLDSDKNFQTCGTYPRRPWPLQFKPHHPRWHCCLEWWTSTLGMPPHPDTSESLYTWMQLSCVVSLLCCCPLPTLDHNSCIFTQKTHFWLISVNNPGFWNNLRFVFCFIFQSLCWGWCGGVSLPSGSGSVYHQVSQPVIHAGHLQTSDTHGQRWGSGGLFVLYWCLVWKEVQGSCWPPQK